MAVKLTSSGACTCASPAQALCAPSAQALPPALDVAEWQLVLQWLDRIDATDLTDDRCDLLRRLRLTQPATASAVLHLLELRRRMVAAGFLAAAWPADVATCPNADRRLLDRR